MRINHVRKYYSEGEIPALSSLNDFDGFYEHVEPARAGNLHSDVLVPFAQAAVTGTLTALSASLLSWLFITSDTTVNLYLFVGILVLVTFAMWIKLLGVYNQLLWKAERFTGKDFDGDGVVGEPDRIVVEVRTPDSSHVEFLHYEVARDALEEFARAALSGESLAVNRWVGKQSPFSRAQFEQLRSAMIADGILAERRGKTVLTAKGQEVFKQMLNR